MSKNIEKTVQEVESLNEEQNQTPKIIPLKDVLQLLEDVRHNKKSEKDWNDFVESLMIRVYVPIVEKTAINVDILTKYQLQYYESIEMQIANLYKNLFFYGLLQGYAFIDCSDESLCTFEALDSLYPIIGVFLEEACKNDYGILKSMLFDSINLSGISNLVTSMENIDYLAMQNAADTNKETLNFMKENSEMVKNLKDILMVNDPLTTKIVEEIKKVD